MCDCVFVCVGVYVGVCVYVCVCVCVCSWHTIIVDGHSVEELCKALSQARHQPTAILAKTVKGKGIPGNPAPLFDQPLFRQVERQPTTLYFI